MLTRPERLIDAEQTIVTLNDVSIRDPGNVRICAVRRETTHVPTATAQFAALHMSAFGTKRTFQSCRSMSAFGGKADIG